MCTGEARHPLSSSGTTGTKNKYAIYAYAHGPVTGSGFLLVSYSVHEQSVNHDQMNVSYHSGSLLVELRVPPSSSLPYSGNVKLMARLSTLAVRKTLY